VYCKSYTSSLHWNIDDREWAIQRSETQYQNEDTTKWTKAARRHKLARKILPAMNILYVLYQNIKVHSPLSWFFNMISSYASSPQRLAVIAKTNQSQKPIKMFAYEKANNH
jgi:hypothetical protein